MFRHSATAPTSTTTTTVIDTERAESGKILEGLKDPQVSEIHRPRSHTERSEKVAAAAAAVAGTSDDPKKVGKLGIVHYGAHSNPHDRLKQFTADEGLRVHFGDLFCGLCQKVIDYTRKSLVDQHITTKSHIAKKTQHAAGKTTSQQAIPWANTHASSLQVNVPTEEAAKRYIVARTWLLNGFSFNAFNDSDTHGMFEALGSNIPKRDQMSIYITAVRDQEVRLLQKMFSGRQWCIIFDGTPRKGDCMAVVVRFAGGGRVHQKLVGLPTLVGQDGDDIAGAVFRTVHERFALKDSDWKRCRALMHDSANILFKFKSPVLQQCVSFTCLSHVLDNCGRQMKFETHSTFINEWFSMFSFSDGTARSWKKFVLQQAAMDGTVSTKSMPSMNNTRWWSSFECSKFLLERWGLLLPFLQQLEYSDNQKEKLLRKLGDVTISNRLKLEMICVDEVGTEFTKATYALEADIPMMFTGGAIIEKLVNFVNSYSTQYSKPLDDEMKKIDYFSANAAHRAQYHIHLDNGVRPLLKYFADRFISRTLNSESGSAINRTVDALRGCRLWDPIYIAQHPLTADELRARLRLFPGLTQTPNATTGAVDESELNKLVKEYTQYLQAATTDPPAFTEEEQAHIHLRGPPILRWWHTHGYLLPAWAALADVVAVLQPSSAGSERCFSIMNALFDDSQTQVLADCLEAATMLRHNKHCVCKEENCHQNSLNY